jgi:hypothetical protein
VQTDNGLYWQSDYQWGDIPFHYGRWILQPGYGWVWAPDYVWGPAWVFWRQDEGDAAIGWAPLPWGATFVDGRFWWHGAVVAADFDFGLGFACFTFVGYDHFHEGFFRMRGHEWRWHVDHERLRGFYGHSVVRNEFRRDEHGRFVNNGIGRERLAQVTHGRVERAGFEERHPVGNREQLARDRVAHPTSATAGHPGGQNFGTHGTTGGGPANNISHSTTENGHPGGENFGTHGTTGGSPGNNISHSTTENAGHPGGFNPGSHGATGGATGGGAGGGGAGGSSVSKVFRPPVQPSTPSRPSGSTGGGGGGGGGGKPPVRK